MRITFAWPTWLAATSSESLLRFLPVCQYCPPGQPTTCTSRLGPALSLTKPLAITRPVCLLMLLCRCSLIHPMLLPSRLRVRRRSFPPVLPTLPRVRCLPRRLLFVRLRTYLPLTGPRGVQQPPLSPPLPTTAMRTQLEPPP